MLDFASLEPDAEGVRGGVGPVETGGDALGDVAPGGGAIWLEFEGT